MNYLRHLVTKYPLSSLLIVVIWILCFCTPPHVRLHHVNAIDKWTHAVMYLGTCATIWWEYLRQHKKVDWRKALLLAWWAPIAMSGVIELLQAHCTGGRRSGEWLDFAANSVGATLALFIGILAGRFRARR